jgi:hypothetical protein
MEHDLYSWSNVEEVANTETGAGNRADLRIPAGAHEMVSRCSAAMKTNEFRQEQCKWYRKATGTDEKGGIRCMYDKWGYMCDKLILNGEGVN